MVEEKDYNANCPDKDIIDVHKALLEAIITSGSVRLLLFHHLSKFKKYVIFQSIIMSLMTAALAYLFFK